MSQAQPAGEEKNGGMPAAYSGEIALRREWSDIHTDYLATNTKQ
jgi:hypothetical protein